MGSGRGFSNNMESIQRAFRTVFFVIMLVGSLLISSATLLVSIVDVLAPCIILSTLADRCRSCFGLTHGWSSYSFRTSLLDIPLLSLLRSLAIFCVYSICSVPSLTSYGPYLGTTGVCAVITGIVLIVKACIFADYDLRHAQTPGFLPLPLGRAWAMLLLYLCSMFFAIGHIMVAYKVRCQARRKMHLYRLDQEAVSGLNTLLYVRK